MRSSHENIYRSLFPRYGSKVVALAGRHSSLIQQDERRPQGTEIEQVYSSQWRKLSDQVPPRTEVVIVGDSTGTLPIHDRWWLKKGSGLKMGTSFNGSGGKRETEIAIMTEKEADQREREVDEYLTFRSENITVLV